jgi:uncharacterized protein (DUF1800 family)
MRKLRLAARLVLGLCPVALALACSGAPPPRAVPAPARALPPAGAPEAPPPAPEPPPDPASVQRAVHALNRLGYGPRPGEAAAVARLGVEAWVARQLDPASIDDRAFEAELAAMGLRAPAMSIAELQEHYPHGGKKKAAAAGSPPAGAASVAPAGGAPGGAAAVAAGTPPGAPAAGATGGAAGGPAAGAGDDPKRRPAAIVHELSAQKLARAVASERQLQEVLADFWFNHFNVFAEKDKVRWYVASYERDAIRPHLFGRFRDLLGASARHPAMLVYLDNVHSVAEGPAGPGGRARGLNENYARELLELHTLGVDGGYSQGDVREVARALTGWTVDRGEGDAAFAFRARAHDRGPKAVLGTMLLAGGQADGERVLDLLAAHPSTARFVATKLATRFVADAPPPALVARLAETFRQTDGDLRAVYAELFRAPEFWAEGARGAKTKAPFEFAASALRAVGARYDGGGALVRRVEQLGEPPYRCQPPTGFADTAEAWVNAGALLARLNFGLDLASGRVAGVTFDPARLATPPPADVGALVDRLAASIVSGPPSARTRDTAVAALARSAGAAPADEHDPARAALALAPRALGLLLGSPEFQKR